MFILKSPVSSSDVTTTAAPTPPLVTTQELSGELSPTTLHPHGNHITTTSPSDGGKPPPREEDPDLSDIPDVLTINTTSQLLGEMSLRELVAWVLVAVLSVLLLASVSVFSLALLYKKQHAQAKVDMDSNPCYDVVGVAHITNQCSEIPLEDEHVYDSMPGGI